MVDNSCMNGYEHMDVQDDECSHLKPDTITEDLSSQNLTSLPSHVVDNRDITHLLIDYNELTSLPETVGTDLLKLQFFSAIGNSLSTLPCSFGGLCQLSEIYLSENGLKSLPDTFCSLKSLKKLKLTGNELEYLPENFGELSSLELLHCDENNLKELPTSFGLLSRLKELELEYNSLTALSEDFGTLESLEILNLSSNKIETVPESFGDLSHLKNVDISCNQIKLLPQHCKSVHCLQKLYIESNLLHCLPDWLSDLSELTEFSVKDNQLQHQPLSDRFAQGCVKLRHMNLSGNFISKLPDNLGDCTNLEYLHFGSVIGELERRNFQNGNWLPSIPDSFCQLEHLKELHLDENQVSDLPKDFGRLVCLEILDLGQNMLHDLPESFGELRSLRICMLSKNHIQWLPSSFGNLKSLEDLRLDDNELGELPESFNQLKTLKTLDLYSNRLRQIPDALHFLTNLVRLDLDGNDFQIPLSEVPQISLEAKYAERDPQHKDNWRGRPREDYLRMAGDVVKVECYAELDFEPPPPSLNYNEDFLVSAMERNMSLWKSHSKSSDPRPRQSKRRPIRNYYGTIDVGGEDVGDDQSGGSVGDDGSGVDQSDLTDDDDFVPPLLIEAKRWSGLTETKPNPVPDTSNSTPLVEETECWDDEVESLPEYYDNVHVPEVHPTKLYYPPVYNGKFTFSPHDLHKQDYVKCPEAYSVEDDQFVDCDEDQTTEISVDPVF